MTNNYIDLGEKNWRKLWISKQYIVEFLRCQYRVYLSLTKGIPISEMKDTALIQSILNAGLEFEEDVVSDIKPLEIQDKEALEPLYKEKVLIQVPKIFRNHELGIVGIPDLLSTNKGSFLPIEIKNHKEVTYTDELELAFYWLLLSPLRRKKVKPRGYIVLNTDEIVEVKLTLGHFGEIAELLKAIRGLVKNGSTPSLSQECKQCNLKITCREEVVKTGGLSLVHNISCVREQQFHTLGVNNISALMKIDEDEMNEAFMAEFGNTPGSKELFRMKCHAFSLKSGTPFFFGKEEEFVEIATSPLVVIDLEYDPGFIWLAGICIKTGKRKTYKQYFAEKATSEEEKKLLEFLLSIINRYPKHALITYAGKSADIPMLRNAFLRHGYPLETFYDIEGSHIDIFYLIQNAFRFPTHSFSLKDIENYLEIKRKSSISNGFEALSIYHSYVRTKDKDLMQELINYNKEDLQSTLALVEEFPRLIEGSLRI